ncbi:MAG TPA: PspC domain-containing protein [Chitinophagaceae bacterium]|nr:PspC domain-containing protein [Chitinophagaceae bacterium]
MKKIININLSGRVIPIEDSAYEKLQAYIESLRRYFVNEEGRDEIINDIESRIAELMNEKIRRGADSVTDADIDEIISSMGRPEDFDAAEAETISAGAQKQQTSSKEEAYPGKKRGRLYRNSSDKILGGVASGIANYLDIDPAVMRILMLLFVFTAGFGILLYIILWIVLPSKDLDNYRGKRLFRNPDDKIIAGVAGGLGAYFKIQAWIIRLILLSPLLLNIIFGTFNGIFFAWHRDIFPNLFIAPFTGTFILAYIILWMVLPEARSPFEKMEMRGERVDVNTIRQNVQEGMSDVKTRMQNWGEEVKTSAQQIGDRAKEFANTRGKVWASEVADTTRPAVRGIAHIIGVLFKAFFIFIAGCIALFLFAALMILIFGGITSWPVNNFLWTSNLQKLSAWGTLLFFITIPVVAFMTWLIRRIVRVRSKSPHLGWIFGGLWLVGWICAITFAASIAKDLRVYDRTDAIEVPITQPAKGKMIVKVNEPEIRYNGTVWWIHDDNAGWDITDDSLKYNNVKIRYDKSDDTLYHVRMYKYSAGSNLTDVKNRASQTIFNLSSQDSILNMGSGLAIHKNSKFRGQGVIVEIEIPVGKKISFDESVLHAFNPWAVRRTWKERRYWGRRWQSDWDYDDYSNLKPGIDYTMQSDGKLINPEEEEEKKQKDDEYRYNEKKDLKKSIQEREKKLEEDRRQLDEDKKRLQDTIPNKNIKKERQVSNPDHNVESVAYSPIFSFTNLLN